MSIASATVLGIALLRLQSQAQLNHGRGYARSWLCTVVTTAPIKIIAAALAKDILITNVMTVIIALNDV